MRLALLTLFLIPSLSLPAPKCEEGNAVLPGELNAAVALFEPWLKHAQFCDFGKIQVLLSTDPKDDVIMVFKDNRPFMYYEHGTELDLIQDYPDKKNVPFLTVQDRDQSGIFRFLDYSLVDTGGNIIGHARDTDMTGTLKVFRYTPEQLQRK